jgi:ribosomal-protein-alanine N-acetyltransferase
LIETERLIIRLPLPADVPEIVRYYSSNRDFFQPVSPTFVDDMFDPKAWLEQVRIRDVEFTAGEAMRAFIFARAEPSRIVGNLSLTQVIRGALQSCVVGYNLAQDEQHKGYMTEAVRAAVDFAFQHWNLHSVRAGYMPRNAASAAVLARCGFTIEGQANAYLLINGRWEDHVLVGITNPDWVASQAPS